MGIEGKIVQLYSGSILDTTSPVAPEAMIEQVEPTTYGIFVKAADIVSTPVLTLKIDGYDPEGNAALRFVDYFVGGDTIAAAGSFAWIIGPQPGAAFSGDFSPNIFDHVGMLPARWKLRFEAAVPATTGFNEFEVNLAAWTLSR